jgi:hypothetical protein
MSSSFQKRPQKGKESLFFVLNNTVCLPHKAA